MSTHSIRAVVVVVASVCVAGVLTAFLFGTGYQEVRSGVGDNLSGFAWSETVGWISMNNVSDSSSTNYGVNVAPDGTISGYAWSEHIGWISFNETSGCPSGSCVPKFDKVSGAVTGWVRAMSAPGAGGNAGGWDGWISLSGVGYGVTVDNNCAWGGYAWGSEVVGWVNFGGNGGAVTGVGDACRAGMCVGSQPTNSTLCSVDDPVSSMSYTVVPSCALPGMTKCHYACNTGYAPVGGSCVIAKCNNGVDDDGDGVVDFPQDAGCTDISDNDESNPIVDPTISATPRVVENGQTTELTWTTGGVNENQCSFTVGGVQLNPNPALADDVPSDNLLEGTTTTQPIYSRTTATIDCNGRTGSVIIEIIGHGYES